MQRALLTLNLLKAEAVSLLIKVTQAWPLPLLVFLRICLFQAVNVLRHLLQNLQLKLALRLTGPIFALDSIGTGLRRAERGSITVELALLRRRLRRFDSDSILDSFARVCEGSLGVRLHYSRHGEGVETCRCLQEKPRIVVA